MIFNKNMKFTLSLETKPFENPNEAPCQHPKNRTLSPVTRLNTLRWYRAVNNSNNSCLPNQDFKFGQGHFSHGASGCFRVK